MTVSPATTGWMSVPVVSVAVMSVAHTSAPPSSRASTPVDPSIAYTPAVADRDPERADVEPGRFAGPPHLTGRPLEGHDLATPALEVDHVAEHEGGRAEGTGVGQLGPPGHVEVVDVRRRDR